MHGEIARDLVLLLARLLDLRRLEAHVRALLHVEEVGRLEVRVALLDAGIEAGGIDLDVRAALGRVLGIVVQRPGDLPEAAVHGAHHHVLDGECGGGVRRVDLQLDGQRGHCEEQDCQGGLHGRSPPVIGICRPF